MTELKTQPTEADVTEFLNKVEDPQRRSDCLAVLELMRAASGHEPRMWGEAIVGFGKYTYHYASGRSGDWMVTGFSPRKAALTIYVWGYLDSYADILSRLGKYTTGKGCLYIKRLSDVNSTVLAELVRTSHQRQASQG